ncbi:hypothetical protein BDN72DRAFT_871310 [Pluteus cervinus]|uniref:Uncharacterized protein n=1 Tax=Pluteus cervinus TaxID=181527 RepID=A0ACD3AN68_9AGAR|nr:hypothetical protein BDN72DRAFT_871310 [Pluteus cervinus]
MNNSPWWQPPQPQPANTGYYNPQHVYVPPQQYNAYWESILAWKPQLNSGPIKAAYRSPKYPSLNPILASDTTLLQLDIRKDPRTEVNSSVYFHNRHSPAVASSSPQIRLISKSFPWTIDIMSPVPITCEMVWDALYNGLQHNIVDSEWGLIVSTDKKHKDMVLKYAKRREGFGGGTGNIGVTPGNGNATGNGGTNGGAEGPKVYKRIDYLGDGTMFRGLEKDEEYESLRGMPDLKPVVETWVVKMSS